MEYSVCDGWPEILAARNFGDLDLGTQDTDEQSRQACTAPAVESSVSTDHHATAMKDQAHVSGFL